jgi:hypothetical protein
MNQNDIILLAVGVLIVVAVLVFLTIKGARAEAYNTLLDMVIKAEGMFLEKGKGAEKLEWVTTHIYSVLPTYVKMLVTEKQLSSLLEKAVSYMNSTLLDMLKTKSQTKEVPTQPPENTSTPATPAAPIQDNTTNNNTTIQ